MTELHVLPTAEEAAQAKARFVAALAKECSASQGRFTIALSGGNTPRRLYQVLASPSPQSRSSIVRGVNSLAANMASALRSIAAKPSELWCSFLLSQITTRESCLLGLGETLVRRWSHNEDSASASGTSKAALDTTSGPSTGPYPASSIPATIPIQSKEPRAE